MCRIYDLVVDLLQGAPYLFAARLKADSDSGVTRTKKTSYVGETLENFWLLTSVGETDSDSGVNWTK